MKIILNKHTNGQRRYSRLFVTTLGSLTLGSASAEITKVTSRAALEAASDQTLFTDSLDGVTDDLPLGNGSIALLSGVVSVSGTVDLAADFAHHIDTAPARYPTGFGGVDSSSMQHPILFFAPGADAGATLTLEFADHPDQAHTVGFDFSGAAGYINAPPGILQTTWRVTTADGQSLEAAFEIDDGFLGFHSASSPIRTIEFFDALPPGTDFGWETMAIDNLTVSIPDQDDDGLHDRYEEEHGLNKAVNDAADDPDEDGLSNLEEYARQTDPHDSDTDDDGIDDHSESNAGTNPINPDTDRDGLLDGVESNSGVFVDAGNTGTDPLNSDSDGDGTFSDGEEVRAGFDPNDISKTPESLVSYGFDSGEEGFTQATTGATPRPGSFNSTPGTWSFAGDNSGASLNTLTGPMVTLTTSGKIHIHFDHRFSTEPLWDGVTLQASKNGGAFETVPAANFIRNGYTAPSLIGAHGLKGEPGFESISLGYDQGHFITSVADLGDFVEGDTIQVRFAGAWDIDGIGMGNPNWELDDMLLRITTDHELKISAGNFDPTLGEFTLTWHSRGGAYYGIERSSDLKVWTTVQASVPSMGHSTSFSDTNLPTPAPRALFYRVRESGR
ncbi:hypothetical protein V2O64_06925 [Verrucomicrobiaceae bacterium 227]